MRTLHLLRDLDRAGCSDEWKATIDGLRPGIGKNRTEAIGSLVGANLEAFGITRQIDEDPKAEPTVVEWMREGF